MKTIFNGKHSSRHLFIFILLLNISAITSPVQSGEINGLVWLDDNGNGLQDANESLFAQTVPDFGAPNIALYPEGSIELIDLIFLDEDSEGQFRFENLADGVYYLCVSNEFLELGLHVTEPNAGDDSIDSDCDFSPCSYDIRVSDGQRITRDLGLAGSSDTPVDPDDPIIPTDPVNPSEPTDPGTGNTIGGLVWLDSNGNGFHDNNESGFGQIIPGFGTPPIVELYDAEYAVVELIELNESRNGHYKFTNLADGVYHLCISQIYRNIGLFISPANVGDDDTIDNDFGFTSCVTEDIIVSGQQTANYDMGLAGDGTQSGGTINGCIWIDNNNNRIIDNNEGIRTVVSIQPGSFDRDVEAIGMFQRHVASNPNGDYEFTDLPTGTYEVNCEGCRFGQLIRVTSPGSNVTRDLPTQLGNRNIIEVDSTNCTLQEALNAANLVKQVGGCESTNPNHALIVLESNSNHPAVDHARFPLQRPTPADRPGISKPTVKIYGNGATIESFTTKADNFTEQHVGFAEIFNAQLGSVTNSGSFVILRHVTVDGAVTGFGTPDGGVTPNLFSTLGSASGNGVFLQDSHVLGDASLVNFVIRSVVNGSLSLVNRAGFSDSGTVKNSTVNHLKFNDQIITINDSLIGSLFINNFEGSFDDLPDICINSEGIVNSNCLLN
ncbi:MAG: hypothetical protein K0U68_15785 [Gammaproteobacteria bacterium]|nr:hypothetical protein [Gammaproteobacteria bacterium]